MTGIGACIKLVAPYVLLVLLLYEIVRMLSARRGAARELQWRPLVRLAGCAAVAAGVFVGLLAILDRIAPPYDSVTAKLVRGGPFGHIAHMLSYGASQTSPHGPQGIASYPWTWIVDYKPIVYLAVNPAKPTAESVRRTSGRALPGDDQPAADAAGIAVAAARRVGDRQAVRAPRPSRADAPDGAGAAAAPTGDLPLIGLAWFLGTFLPFALLTVLDSRTSYIYYMVVVMPGIYMTVVYLLFRARRYRKLIGAVGAHRAGRGDRDVSAVADSPVLRYADRPFGRRWSSNPKRNERNGRGTYDASHSASTSSATAAGATAGHVDHVHARELAHPRQLPARVVAGAALHRLDVAGQQLVEAERLARGRRGPGGVRAA